MKEAHDSRRMTEQNCPTSSQPVVELNITLGSLRLEIRGDVSQSKSVSLSSSHYCRILYVVVVKKGLLTAAANGGGEWRAGNNLINCRLKFPLLQQVNFHDFRGIQVTTFTEAGVQGKEYIERTKPKEINNKKKRHLQRKDRRLLPTMRLLPHFPFPIPNLNLLTLISTNSHSPSQSFFYTVCISRFL